MTIATMRRSGVGLGLLAIALIGAGRGDDPKAAAAADLKAMQGAWDFEEPDGATGTFTFNGDKLRVEVGDNTYVATVTLRPDAKPLPEIDFMVTEGPDEAKGRTSVGVYRLEGKTLAFCVADRDKPRPREFRSIEGEQHLINLTR